ncbi:MAG: endonuclease III domain-containing protein [Candidatus Micrarchaeota archaeon]
MSEAYRLYRELLSEYGPQRWWPADSRYEVVVGALLTQNTNWKNVEKAIANLKEAGLLSPEKLLETQNPELETLIRPSGFYRQKAERLKALTERYLELLERGTEPTREDLLDVKGVGKETADSILLYAFDLPYFVIDAYTRRFCAHHQLFQGKEHDDYRQFFESSLPKDVSLYKEYHALIVEWGKRFRSR